MLHCGGAIDGGQAVAGRRSRGWPQAIAPPSTVMLVPVICRAPGPARKATAAAISSGLPKCPERDPGELRVGCLAIRRVHLGVGRAGVHQVDGDAARPELAGQAAIERQQRRLRHRIYGDPAERHALGEPRADRDDAAAIGQMGDRRLRGEDDRADVHGEQGIDIGKALLGDEPAAGDAGIVHEDVEAAEAVRRFVDRALHRRRIGAVGLDRDAAPTHGLDRAHYLGGAVGGALVGDGDIRPLVGERQRNGGTDAARGAGHQSPLASQFSHDRCFLC